MVSKGLFENYCQDNEEFIDAILVFGSTNLIQRMVQGFQQGKYSEEVVSDKFLMKVIGLLFKVGQQQKSQIKPYLYQLHLWQVINALVSAKLKKDSTKGPTLMSYLLFALKTQFGKMSTTLSTSQAKNLRESFEVTKSGISNYSMLCLQCRGAKENTSSSVLENLLDSFIEIRACKHLDLLQLFA